MGVTEGNQAAARWVAICARFFVVFFGFEEPMQRCVCVCMCGRARPQRAVISERVRGSEWRSAREDVTS